MAPRVQVANSQTTWSLPVALVAWGLGTKDQTVCGAPCAPAPHIDRFPVRRATSRAVCGAVGCSPAGAGTSETLQVPPQERVHFRRQLKDVSLCSE